MSDTAVTPEVTKLAEDQADQAGKCATCPHPTAEHDPISARYCVATVAGGFTRGCVCTPSTMRGSRLNT
jgi:hypothetical protein